MTHCVHGFNLNYSDSSIRSMHWPYTLLLTDYIRCIPILIWSVLKVPNVKFSNITWLRNGLTVLIITADRKQVDDSS